MLDNGRMNDLDGAAVIRQNPVRVETLDFPSL
jgi:hypothetical protein